MKALSFPEKIRKRTRGVVFVNALWAYLCALAFIALLFYVLFGTAYFIPRTIPFRLSAAALISAAVFLPSAAALMVGLLQQRDTRRLTLTLEQSYPQLGNRLMTMMELSEKKDVAVNPFSRALAKGLEEEVNEIMDRFGFGRAVSWKKPLVPLAVLSFLILAGAAHAMVQPQFFIRGFQHLTQGVPEDFMPPPAFSQPLPQFQIEVIPGNCDIATGSNLLIKARISQYSPQQVELRVKQSQEPGWRVLPMTRVENQEYQYILTHVTQASQYFVQADHERSPTYTIHIFEPLQIQRALWRMEFPAYMKLPEQRIEGWREKITVPRGTKLDVELNMNRPVSPGWISVESGKRTPLTLENPRRMTASFIANQDLIVRLDVLSAEGEPLWGVSPLWVQTLPDLDPYVEVLEPQLQNYVFPTQEIPFEININDDYGISAVTLVIRYQQKEERIEWLPSAQPKSGKTRGESALPVKAEDAEPTNLVLKPTLELERFKLFPRDMVMAHLEVKDNYPGSPPHIVHSPLFIFVVRDYVEQFIFTEKESGLPSLRKLFEDVLIEQEKIIQDAWDYLSMSPLEAPKGWEKKPDTES